MKWGRELSSGYDSNKLPLPPPLHYDAGQRQIGRIERDQIDPRMLRARSAGYEDRRPAHLREDEE